MGPIEGEVSDVEGEGEASDVEGEEGIGRRGGSVRHWALRGE